MATVSPSASKKRPRIYRIGHQDEAQIFKNTSVSVTDLIITALVTSLTDVFFLLSFLVTYDFASVKAKYSQLSGVDIDINLRQISLYYTPVSKVVSTQ